MAVLVTYNRSELLREALEAVLAQTVPVEVLVVDNASTDGTRDVLLEFGDRVNVLRLAENTGGAGGFHAGMVAGLESGAEWLWLMDDDTVPLADCLERLLAADLRAGGAAGWLASRVEWVDGQRHPMNAGLADLRLDKLEAAAAAGCVALRQASFVSVLVARSSALQHGLPMRDYFIWVDDVEYTMRITRDGLGLLVPDSVAVHKTTYFALDGLTPRFYYHVRNWLWLFRFSPGLDGGRRGPLLRHLRTVAPALRRGQDRAVVLAALRGLRDGVLTRPDLTPLRPWLPGQSQSIPVQAVPAASLQPEPS